MSGTRVRRPPLSQPHATVRHARDIFAVGDRVCSSCRRCATQGARLERRLHDAPRPPPPAAGPCGRGGRPRRRPAVQHRGGAGAPGGGAVRQRRLRAADRPAERPPLLRAAAPAPVPGDGGAHPQGAARRADRAAGALPLRPGVLGAGRPALPRRPRGPRAPRRQRPRLRAGDLRPGGSPRADPHRRRDRPHRHRRRRDGGARPDRGGRTAALRLGRKAARPARDSSPSRTRSPAPPTSSPSPRTARGGWRASPPA